MLRSGHMTFVLVYADWCGHCQKYKPMWQKLSQTPGRIANMAAVRDDMFAQIPEISNAKIQGYPSVIKVSPDGSIEKYTVNGEQTNAIDSAKMRDMSAMKTEITSPPRTMMASNIPTPKRSPQPLNTTSTMMRETPEESETDIYTPVTSMANSPGSLISTEDREDLESRQTGGGLGISASFINAIQSVGPAALLLTAHALLPKRARTYKSPKRTSHRGGTRRRHRR